ncbi:Flagellar motor rotation protein MotB [Enhygromyxa salina]|uniref:Flagellar motor rotation protein MotB n=1 Tax=Enhygromyxa salina TaxID=215803 RepID=A0A0C1Z9N0_9BACT|nr:OmpA family protein [Enhygromyxa salina]KIG14269.1 Flagellar motor rotation protein MotB [Enhygromyxa salina]
MFRSRFSLPLVVLLSLAGCVAQAEYDSALKDLDTSRKAHAGLAEQLAACQAQLSTNGANADAALADQLAATEAELAELRRQREAVEKRLEAFRQLNEKLAELIAAGDLEVYIRNGLPVIALPSEVLFAVGNAELSEKGRKSLDRVGAALATMKDQRIQVSGHTDNQPTKKSKWTDNWQLSTERALTVTRFLIDKGVTPEHLSAAGHAEFDPVARNTKKGRVKNRRIELVLLPDLSELTPIIETDE